MPLVSRTRATFRRAEFGFLGVVVNTRVQTPRRWGAPFRAGVFVFDCLDCRPLRTSCSIVGTRDLSEMERDMTRGTRLCGAPEGAPQREPTMLEGPVTPGQPLCPRPRAPGSRPV